MSPKKELEPACRCIWRWPRGGLRMLPTTLCGRESWRARLGWICGPLRHVRSASNDPR